MEIGADGRRFKEGYVKLAPFGPAVNGLAQQKARDAISRIVSGNLRVFQGPLVDNKGVQRVARGEILDVPRHRLHGLVS